MFRFYTMRQGSALPGSGSAFFISLGIMLLLIGIAIVAMPELLALLVATMIIFAGMGLLGFGMHLRRLEKFQSQFIVEPDR